MSRKHSIIVGGSKGVGRELALLFAAEGQVVTVAGRTVVDLGHADIHSIAANAEKPDALLAGLQESIAAHGPVSSLVFLQRYRGNGDAWAGELAVALTATKTVVDGLADAFGSDGDRSICVVTSSAATLVARNQTLAYHTSKAALKQMARFYAVKLGGLGIRVNVVSPCTFVKSESADYYAKQIEVQAMYAKITPLGRMGTAREVAEAAAWLCGPKASFITGQDIAVDGGLSLMLQDAMAREVSGIKG